MGENRNSFRLLVRRPKEKRPLRRPMSRWEDSIRIHLKEMGLEDIN
jgi:hypothetical protein